VVFRVVDEPVARRGTLTFFLVSIKSQTDTPLGMTTVLRDTDTLRDVFDGKKNSVSNRDCILSPPENSDTTLSSSHFIYEE
jgi:hypothetical protein